MNIRIFAALVFILIIGGSYIVSKNQTEEGKVKSYNFMMLHMK